MIGQSNYFSFGKTALIMMTLQFRMKQDRLRREMHEKYERSLFTPTGLKTFRLQPSIDSTSILKVIYFNSYLF